MPRSTPRPAAPPGPTAATTTDPPAIPRPAGRLARAHPVPPGPDQSCFSGRPNRPSRPLGGPAWAGRRCVSRQSGRGPDGAAAGPRRRTGPHGPGPARAAAQSTARPVALRMHGGGCQRAAVAGRGRLTRHRPGSAGRPRACGLSRRLAGRARTDPHARRPVPLSGPGKILGAAARAGNQLEFRASESPESCADERCRSSGPGRLGCGGGGGGDWLL